MKYCRAKIVIVLFVVALVAVVVAWVVSDTLTSSAWARTARHSKHIQTRLVATACDLGCMGISAHLRQRPED